MIRVLDTNVVAEMMSPSPNPSVVAFLDGLAEPPCLTVVTVAEVLLRIAVLPKGKRRNRLEEAADLLIEALGRQRILPVDELVAREFASVVSFRRANGRPISQFDALIAGICRVHGAELVTRNVRDFELTGLGVINPWTDGPARPE